MKITHKWLVTLFVLLATTAAIGNVFSADKAVTVTGYVNTSYDDDYNITGAVLLSADDLTYHLTMDEKGQGLADDNDGEQVEVNGTVAEKDNEKWLTVKSFKKIETEDDDEVDWQEDTDSAK